MNTNKGIDLTGLLGDIKEDWGSENPSGVQGRSLVVPVGSLGDKVPQWGPGRSLGRGSWGRSPPEAEAFFVKLHIIFALKYNKQQLLSLESIS